MPITSNTKDQILGTLRNQLSAAEGTLLPPQQQGSPFRVPFVTNLSVYTVTTFTGGTQFTLIFNEPEGIGRLQIDHYNVFIAGLTGNQNDLQGPTSVTGSPAIVRVNTQTALKLTFKVQTVLKSGLVSDLASSPSCTGTSVASTITSLDIPPGTITLAQMAHQTEGSIITYDATGTATLLTPGTAGQVLSTQGAGALPLYINMPTILFVETTTATVANSVAETTLIGAGVGSVTLPANFLTAGRTILVRAFGLHSAVGGPTIQLKVKAGSTVLLDTTAVNTHNQTNAVWELVGFITCYTTGNTGTVWAQGRYVEEGNASFQMVNTATVTLDTTVTQTLDITVTWGTANPSNTITSTNLYIQSLN